MVLEKLENINYDSKNKVHQESHYYGMKEAINRAKFDKKQTEYIGYNSCHKSIDNLTDNPSEIVIRIGVIDYDKSKVNEFGKEIAPLITNGPPGVTGFAGGRPKAQEVIAYWPSLIDKSKITTKVDVY